MIFGIRREDKSVWERRVPVVPSDVKELMDRGYRFVVQPSPIRIFPDQEYVRVGAEVKEDLSECDVILGVKEIPPAKLLPGKIYMFFSHTIKGQPYNMPMLKKLLELGCTLIDYERIVDERGRRLIFFGHFAGYAGFVDTLWAFGKRLEAEGIENPFSSLQPAHRYPSLEKIKEELKKLAEKIKKGLPEEIVPLVIGIAGYGNVSRGVQELLDLLPVIEVDPHHLSEVFSSPKGDVVYKVVFKEEHMVEPLEGDFDLQDYYQNPQRYRSVFARYLPYLTIFINAIYWDARYPRLVTKEDLKRLYSEGRPRLRVIGDISCDIEGAVEATVKSTDPSNPVYVYDVEKGEAVDGVEGKGPVILAVDILPSEIPKEASEYFSSVLKNFLPAIAEADFSLPFEKLNLPPELRRAVIVYKGELTPDYRYLSKFI